MLKLKYEYKSFVPFRVCPLGAHIDHQLGKVTGFAINYGITMHYRALKNGNFNIICENYAQKVIFNYTSLPKFDGSWLDYLVGSIKVLQEEYFLKQGIKAYIEKSIPTGGLASSSAIIISYISALCKVNNIQLTKEKIINLVQKVERKYMHNKVGILDPACEIYCQKNSLLYLDIKKQEYHLIKPQKKMHFKICLVYSGLSKKLSDTIYNVRVDECKSAAFSLNNFLKNQEIEYDDAYLGNIRYQNFKRYQKYLPAQQVLRAEHFYEEMKRVTKGIKYFEKGDLVNFGKYIFASGSSSIKKYQTGSKPLELLHKIAQKTKGIYGGRFSGAGFRGYYMALIDPQYEKEIEKRFTKEYLKVYPEYRGLFKIYFCDINGEIEI